MLANTSQCILNGPLLSHWLLMKSLCIGKPSFLREYKWEMSPRYFEFLSLRWSHMKFYNLQKH